MKLLRTGESVKLTDIVFTHIKLIISRGMSKIHFVASGHRPQRYADYNKPILYYGIMIMKSTTARLTITLTDVRVFRLRPQLGPSRFSNICESSIHDSPENRILNRFSIHESILLVIKFAQIGILNRF